MAARRTRHAAAWRAFAPGRLCGRRPVMHEHAPVGITMGDAAGIGPEIVVKACAQGLKAPALVYGDADTLRRAAALLGARLDIADLEIGRAHVCTPVTNVPLESR